jgi:excisionase family DNA binding protein
MFPRLRSSPIKSNKAGEIENMKKTKVIDSPLRFAVWLNKQFDAVRAGGVDRASILREASLNALRVGAGDLVGTVTDDTSQTAALDVLGKLLAWCRSQEAFVWDFDRAAEELQISPHTLSNVTKEGEIPFQRLGSQYRFSPAALRKWLDFQQICA